MTQQKQKKQTETVAPEKTPDSKNKLREERPVEKGGPKGPEPTRYGDWEINGKCVDF